MKNLPIRYLPSAVKDIEDIFDYIRRDAPGNAAKWLDGIDASIAKLPRFPLSGTIPKDSHLKRKKYRTLVFGSYLIFYKVEKTGVFIYRILHGKRRYAFLL